MHEAFYDFCINLMGSKDFQKFFVNWSCLYPGEDRVSLISLDEVFSKEEIRKAVFELAGDKALDQMAFLLYFIKNFGR